MKPYYEDSHVTIYHGDCREVLPQLAAAAVHTCVTSPPYFGLRRYTDNPTELGLEPTPAAYVAEMTGVFEQVKRVLRQDGTAWLNLGDSYSTNPGNGRGGERNDGGVPHRSGADKTACDLASKQLIGIPWRVAFALQDAGWYLRSDIIWAKGNPMPESVTDRPTKAHEYLFLLAKAEKYYYDAEAIREPHITGDRVMTNYQASGVPSSVSMRRGDESRIYANNPAGRNKRSVWTINTQPFKDWTQTSHRVRVAQDEADDDTTRITSPDCPLHGDRIDRAPRAFGDEHAGRMKNRTLRNGNYPAPEQSSLLAPTDQIHEPDFAGDSSGLPHLENDPSATDHNRQTSRTDLDPVTNQPYMLSAQTTFGTLGRPVSPANVETPHDMSENSREIDDSDAHPSGNSEPRIDDIPSQSVALPAFVPPCTCEYYKVVTKSISHFATFPEKLIEPCILAGTPAQVCAACGAPWVRQVEKGAPIQQHWAPGTQEKVHIAQGAHGKTSVLNTGYTRPNITTGFAPTCQCNAGTVPGTVLDPFGGSGTTARVAKRLGRRCVIVEQNEQYAEMSAASLVQQAFEVYA